MYDRLSKEYSLWAGGTISYIPFNVARRISHQEHWSKQVCPKQRFKSGSN